MNTARAGIMTNKKAHPSRHLLFKANYENTRTIYEICSKLIIKTPDQRPRLRSDVFHVSFEQISYIIQEFPLLTLNK